MDFTNEIDNLLSSAGMSTYANTSDANSTNLSESDFDDILQSIGFEEVQEAEAEEIEDLDNIEDSPLPDAVHFYMPSGEEIVVPIQQEVEYAEETDASPCQLPPNSPTLLIDDTTSRFSGAEWYNEIRKQNIILAGLGGIGSWTALQLSRMHPNMMLLYDDDIVESANMSGQLYTYSNIDQNKALATRNNISTFGSNTINIRAIPRKFTESTEPGNIMICGFDNMKARKTFFASWLNYVAGKPAEERNKCLYIDGRLSLDLLQVFCIRGDDSDSMLRYEKDYLFSDEEAEATVCSMKQTTYLACMIGSFIVNLFTNHVANLLNPVLPYDLPFFTMYDAQNMIFKTEY